TSSAKASMDAGSARSTGTKRTAAPVPASSSLVLRPRSVRMSQSTRRAPWRAHAAAITRPTPRAAPVTTMVRPPRMASPVPSPARRLLRKLSLAHQCADILYMECGFIGKPRAAAANRKAEAQQVADDYNPELAVTREPENRKGSEATIEDLDRVENRRWQT